MLMMALRLVHIIGGLFWVGAVGVVAWFLFPAQRASRGGNIMEEVMGRRRLGMWIGIAAMSTLLSGFILYGRNAAVTDGAWASSAPGIGFGIGALVAVLATIVGVGAGMRTGARLQKLGASLHQSGGPPDPALVSEMERLSSRGSTIMRTVSVLLLIATAAMATARYW